MRDDYGSRVIERGRASLGRLGRAIDDADPEGLVLPRSRVLCAGLAELAVTVLGALSPVSDEGEVVDLAASLSLLTKIDDEVIDSLSFHGGQSAPRGRVRARTEAFLGVTLRAIESGASESSEPRAVFAADVGRRIRTLAATAEARDALLLLVRQGWRTQVDAVTTLTDDPLRVDLHEVDRVTRRISGDWLALIAACGALPSGGCLSGPEVEAIRDAGELIQRADSLADLEKDQREGLTSSWAACRLAESGLDTTSLAARYHACSALGLEQRASPGPALAETIRLRLGRIPELAGWLDWIRSMLLARHRQHALYVTAAMLADGGSSCGAR
jgi:hypothetical protein